MVKVLVVGATGFLGGLIAKEAAKAGHQVTALVSGESQTSKKELVDELKGAGISITTGSLESDHKLLVDVLKSVEAVSCLPHERRLTEAFCQLHLRMGIACRNDDQHTVVHRCRLVIWQ